LAALARHLSDAERVGVLGKALDAVMVDGDERDGDERQWSQVLAALAPYSPEAQRLNALDQALTGVTAISDERIHARALAALIPHLPATLLGKALDAAMALRKEWPRAQILASLAPYLPTVLAGQLDPVEIAADIPACQLRNAGEGLAGVSWRHAKPFANGGQRVCLTLVQRAGDQRSEIPVLYNRDFGRRHRLPLNK
jgi:hypothetical protein